MNFNSKGLGEDTGNRRSALLGVLELILAQKDKIKIVSDLAFQAIDKDGDGDLSHSELGGKLITVATKMGVSPPSESDIRAVLEELDEDGSGTVDKDEFEHLIIQVLKKLMESEEEL